MQQQKKEGASADDDRSAVRSMTKEQQQKDRQQRECVHRGRQRRGHSSAARPLRSARGYRTMPAASGIRSTNACLPNSGDARKAVGRRPVKLLVAAVGAAFPLTL